jgi:hypothetical protein
MSNSMSNSMSKKTVYFFLLCVFGFASASVAKADAVYYLTVWGGGGTPSPSSGTLCGATTCFGDVVLKDLSSTEIQVKVTLASGEVFSNSAMNGHTPSDSSTVFAFDLSGTGTFSISGITTDFAQSASTLITAPSLTSPPSSTDDFHDAIDCTTCSGGNLSNPGGPLIFDVTNTGGITDSDFTAEGNGYYFAADIFSTGFTGDVGDGGLHSSTPPVPEPSSLLLLGTGLAVLAGAMKRKLLA